MERRARAWRSRAASHRRSRSAAQPSRVRAAILDDLSWLGFVADEPFVRQSDRGAIYEDALARLRAAGHVYACDCSRRDVGRSAESLALPGGPGNETKYPGTCADKGLSMAPAAASACVCRRRSNGSLICVGPREQRHRINVADLLAKDRDGNWTYQFAATVDDHVQGVTLVVRGEDLLASTGRQIQLARLLGRANPPQFMHHRLIMKTPSQKLSKSDGDTGSASCAPTASHQTMCWRWLRATWIDVARSGGALAVLTDREHDYDDSGADEERQRPRDFRETRALHEHRAGDRHEVPHRIHLRQRLDPGAMLSMGVNRPLISR